MNERISQILKHQTLVPASIGVGAFGLGAALGYILGRRKTYGEYSLPEHTDFDLKLDEYDLETVEVVEVRREPTVIDADVYIQKGADFVEQTLNEETDEEPVGWIDDQEEDDIPEEPGQVVTHNVFAGTDDEWDYPTEVAKRTAADPYILHKDEFFADERGFNQYTVTYYAGDNMLADQEESPVYNHDQILGELRFGHGSGANNVVYIRNERLRSEYEVLREEGHFAVEVLGLEIENDELARDLKHSNVPKFRDN